MKQIQWRQNGKIRIKTLIVPNLAVLGMLKKMVDFFVELTCDLVLESEMLKKGPGEQWVEEHLQARMLLCTNEVNQQRNAGLLPSSAL